jgi:hypothetical protein
MNFRRRGWRVTPVGLRLPVGTESVFAQTKRRRRRLWPEVEFVHPKAIADFETYVLMGSNYSKHKPWRLKWARR